MLKYWLDFETKGSPSLLNIDRFDDPTGYMLTLKKPGSDECAVYAGSSGYIYSQHYFTYVKSNKAAIKTSLSFPTVNKPLSLDRPARTRRTNCASTVLLSPLFELQDNACPYSPRYHQASLQVQVLFSVLQSQIKLP